jgi:nitroreductase
MQIEEAILKRRSIRKYLDKQISSDQIRKIIRAGTYAPSGKNSQPWRFTVLTGLEKEKIIDLMEKGLKRLEEKHGTVILGSTKNTCRIMKDAPLLILVWIKKDSFITDGLKRMIKKVKEVIPNAEKLQHMVELQGVSAAIQNMLLMAYSMGVGSLWIADIYWVLDELETYFNKEGLELVAGVSFGYPDESEIGKSPPSKLSVDEVTEFR